MDVKAFSNAEEIILAASTNIQKSPVCDTNQKTAVVCVNGYNGLGIQTFLRIADEFPEYKNFAFIEVGIVDAGNFKGEKELANLEMHVKESLAQYERLAHSMGYYTESYHAIGTDVADEIKEISKTIMQKFPRSVFFIGQYIIPRSSAITRMLHNQTQFAIHNRLAHKGFIMVLIPVMFYKNTETE